MQFVTNIEAALGTVMPQKTEVRRVDARSNEYVKVLMHDVLHLKHTTAAAAAATTISTSINDRTTN